MHTAETHIFAGDGRFPNSPLPLMVYRQALAGSADAMEEHFRQRGWSNAWRDGIYRFHHFHSIAHEVLGVAGGQGQVVFGGPSGEIVPISAGDVIVIPAGVAHCDHGHSADFLVVGAYPDGGGWNVKRGDPHEYDECRSTIAAVPLPTLDPFTGAPIALWITEAPRLLSS